MNIRLICQRLSMLSIWILLASCSSTLEKKIVIGSKNFTEQLILAELMAQHIEAKTDLKVERRLNLGGTFVCHQGLLSGELDLYPEYTGTAYSAILKRPPQNDPPRVYRETQQAYRQRFNLEWTEPFGFNNTFAMVVRGEDARRLKLKTLSDAAQHAPQWTAGFGYEFAQRADGFPGLAKVYGLKFSGPPRTMDLGLIYRALTAKQVDMVAGNSTDGVLSRLDLVILKDNKRYFPPYQAAPVVRQQTLQKYPALRQALANLGDRISEAEMQQLNDRVDSQKQDVKKVVREFRKLKAL
ncbi:glycine betaine ABC transporter substrate-binding protein [Altericista sp. CCNU0014]|uniref:glycine betaine ABC transporter substrate-binding protein n=1 Tax=Altericista sp. CCNU0014 TaxID=3082949 RepID=UPI00384D1EEF